MKTKLFYSVFFLGSCYKTSAEAGAILAFLINPWMGLFCLVCRPLAVAVAVTTAFGYTDTARSLIDFIPNSLNLN